MCRCYGVNRTFRGDSFLFRSDVVIVSVSYVCFMHACVVLRVIVQMHVFTSSFSLRHEGLVSHPPTMAAWQSLSQARNQGRWQSPAASGNMVIMVFCTCTACV